MRYDSLFAKIKIVHSMNCRTNYCHFKIISLLFFFVSLEGVEGVLIYREIELNTEHDEYHA